MYLLVVLLVALGVDNSNGVFVCSSCFFVRFFYGVRLRREQGRVLLIYSRERKEARWYIQRSVHNIFAGNVVGNIYALFVVSIEQLAPVIGPLIPSILENDWSISKTSNWSVQSRTRRISPVSRLIQTQQKIQRQW